ncbi:MAG TPA: NADPH-dependent F420 reductase [Vicinamibacteria bacterium]|nr:NADPH-dependent F420 reductase [Vicinamibacteria bacterium]
MRVGVLGTGDVGRALGGGFVTLGHEVLIGSRTSSNVKANAWVKEMGPKASAGTFADAASYGEVLVLATLGTANEQAMRSAGLERLRGKLLIDTTNPLDFSAGTPRLAVTGNDSGGEIVQRLVPEARVVKAFNTVGNAHMFRPSFPGGPPDMFICGNDELAKEKTGEILRDFGWGVVDVGGIDASRYLEAMCMVWVLYGIRRNRWNHAFKLLEK